MKTTTMTFFSVLAIVIAGLMATTTIQTAYAEITVSLPVGSSVPGCEETDACYIPGAVNVGVGEMVTWSNDDTAAHTVTSGSVADGVDGIFDSSLFAAGATFSHTFEEEDTFDYFCMVHPWMVGSVVVGTASAEEDDGNEMKDDMEDKDDDKEMHEMEDKGGEMILKSISSDGTIEINVEAYDPMAGQGMELEVEFLDVASGSQIEHINYDIMAIQNGKTVLSEMGVHQHSGEGEHVTDALDTDDPVDVSITIQGIGVDPPFTGPQGDTIEFTVVPEFGTIAMMILAVAIISIVAISAKSRLSIMPRL